MRGRHYSEFPFLSRTDGGPQSKFEWEALAALKADPSVPYQRFVDDYEGRPALLYATGAGETTTDVVCDVGLDESSVGAAIEVAQGASAPSSSLLNWDKGL